MNKNIYLILFDWSTTDCDGIETFLYHRFEDALKKFNELIENECDSDMSWVGGEVCAENDEVNEAMREQMAAVVAELNDLTEYMNKLKEADEKKRIAAEKRREANRNKPKKPKAPSQKQQIADMQKEIEELKKLLLK